MVCHFGLRSLHDRASDSTKALPSNFAVSRLSARKSPITSSVKSSIPQLVWWMTKPLAGSQQLVRDDDRPIGVELPFLEIGSGHRAAFVIGRRDFRKIGTTARMPGTTAPSQNPATITTIPIHTSRSTSSVAPHLRTHPCLALPCRNLPLLSATIPPQPRASNVLRPVRVAAFVSPAYYDERARCAG